MARQQANPGAGRVPPHNLPAEESVLAAAMTHLGWATEHTIDPADFYKSQHAYIAKAIVDVVNEGVEPDKLTVAEELKVLGHYVDDVPDLLDTIAGLVPSAGIAVQHLKIVHDTANDRRILAAAAAAQDAVYDGTDMSAALAALTEAVTAATYDTGWDFEPLDDTGTTATAAPDFLFRTDGAGLGYHGKMLVFQGEPGTGKSMIAGAAITEVVGNGGTVTILDFEDAKGTWHERLVAMGNDPTTLAGAVTYHRFLNETPEDYVAKVLRIAPTVAIIDSTGRAVRSTVGPKGDPLDDEKAADWNNWRSRVIDRLLVAGITVIIIDHVVKDNEKRGNYAKGTGMKLSDVDGAAYTIKTIRAFSRNTEGSLKMIVAKDRPGTRAAGEVAAIVKVKPSTHLDPAGNTIGRIGIYIDPPATTDNDTGTGNDDDNDTARRRTMSDKLTAILGRDLELSTTQIEKKLAADLTAELGDIGAAIKFSKTKNGPLDILLEERRAAGTIIARDLGTNANGVSRGCFYSLPPAQMNLPDDPENTPPAGSP